MLGLYSEPGEFARDSLDQHVQRPGKKPPTPSLIDVSYIPAKKKHKTGIATNTIDVTPETLFSGSRVKSVEVPFPGYEHDSSATSTAPDNFLTGGPSNPSNGVPGRHAMNEDAWGIEPMGAVSGGSAQSQFEPVEDHDPQTYTDTQESAVWASNLVTSL